MSTDVDDDDTTPDLSPADRVVVEVHVDEEHRVPALAADVRAGLTLRPRWLPPKWFYDDRGSALFDEITRLPEYYPTRAEREILAARAAEIASASGADTLVELGSGTSEKTDLLLDALAGSGRLRAYVPFDVSEETLRQAAIRVAAAHPNIRVRAVVGDFERHLGCLPPGGRRLFAFLGSTIGNLEPADRARFLRRLWAVMAPGDSLLLGTDLVKDPQRLVAAYDDGSGVTAAFNKNVLAVINHELDADFDLSRFDHVAHFDPRQEWIEMHLRSRSDQQVRIAALDLDLTLAAGETIRTEISAKFRPDGVRTELTDAGFESPQGWTDRGGDFGLWLAARGD